MGESGLPHFPAQSRVTLTSRGETEVSCEGGWVMANELSVLKAKNSHLIRQCCVTRGTERAKVWVEWVGEKREGSASAL